MRMKLAVFEALSTLLRGDPESPANRAAKRVLVDGISQADAMRETGATRSSVSDGVRRFEKADSLIRESYGLKPRSKP
jgi:transposase